MIKGLTRFIDCLDLFETAVKISEAAKYKNNGAQISEA